MQNQATQVLIAGCGPVGLTLANCLVKSPYISSITLLDKKLPSWSRDIPQLPNQRVYSLNGPSLQLFDNLGINFRRGGVMSSIQVISKESEEFFRFSQNKAKVVENDELVFKLMENLKVGVNSSKVNFVEDEISGYEEIHDKCLIKLKSKQANIESKLLVGSDGNKSKIKELADIRTYGWSYLQKAIVCTMSIDEKIENQTAYQIYHDGNVFAILPLWDEYVSLVWSVGLADFEHLMSLSNEQFLEKMNNVINNSNYCLRRKQKYAKIPNIIGVQNKRLSFPLSTMQSENYTAQRVALIGDAAHTIHPMAGLGVNSGIMDSIILGNNIIRNIKTGNDIGDHIALGSYESEAKLFNYENSLAMQTIKQSFSHDFWPLNRVRSLGLNMIEKSAWLKSALQRKVQNRIIQYEWEKS